MGGDEKAIIDSSPAGRLAIAISGFKNLSDSNDYYAKIITDSLYKHIRATENFEPVVISASPGVIPSPDRQTVDQFLSGSADYLITGDYKYNDNGESPATLTINCQVVDLSTMKNVTESIESDEVGATFTNTISRLKISTINLISTLSSAKTPYVPQSSPYSSFYKGISGLTMGFEYTYFNLMGDWADIYNNTNTIRTSLSGYGDLWGFALNFEYISFDNRDRDNISAGLLYTGYIWTLHTGAGFMLGEYFRFDIFAGGGLNYSDIKVLTSSGTGPFTDPSDETESFDPCFEGGGRLNLMLGSVVVTGSAYYRHVFYSGIPLKSYLLTFGAGYML
jgi:hypothetical protein